MNEKTESEYEDLEPYEIASMIELLSLTLSDMYECDPDGEDVHGIEQELDEAQSEYFERTGQLWCG